MLDSAAAHRLAVNVDDEEQARGWPDLVRADGRAHIWVESAGRAPVQFGHVLREAVLGIQALGIDGLDLHTRRHEQTLYVSHSRDQPLTLPSRERLEQLLREPVSTLFECGVLAHAGTGEAHNAGSTVRGARRNLDEPRHLERRQQTAQVTGVQTEPCAEASYLAATEPDLPQDACLSKRPVATEEAIVERPDPFGHHPVEPADLLHHCVGHLPDFSQRGVILRKIGSKTRPQHC